MTLTQFTTGGSNRRPLFMGMLLGVLGAMAFSAKAIIVKLAYRHGIDTTTIVAYRMIIALPLFWLLAWWSGRGKPTLQSRDWYSVAILGFFGGYMTCVLDFAGLQYVSAGLERLIVYLTPTLVVLFSVIVLRKPFNWLHGAGLLTSYAGVLMVIYRETLFLGADVGKGALLIFGSAVTYAIYLTYAGEVVKRLGAARLAGLVTTVACLLSIAHFLVLNPMSSLIVPSEVLWLSVVNGTLCTFAPIVMVMISIRRIGAPLAAQCGMVGPIATIVMGVAFLDEVFTTWIACGTVLVLLGISILALGRKQVRTVAHTEPTTEPST